MASTKNVQNAHITEGLRDFHVALLEIASVMNRPERDEEILRVAGISLERALFPLLAVSERFGPIGVLELAARVGRDYTTVSRQLSRLERLGLVARNEKADDRRIKEVLVTPLGLKMIERIDRAREEIASSIFAGWSKTDVKQLYQLIGKFAAALRASD
jgi:DNA-binding MarR family transcriptional regulator